MKVFLSQNDCYRLEGLESDSEAQEFARLRHAMDVVGFSPENQHRLTDQFSSLSLHAFTVTSSQALLQRHGITVPFINCRYFIITVIITVVIIIIVVVIVVVVVVVVVDGGGGVGVVVVVGGVSVVVVVVAFLVHLMDLLHCICVSL